MFSVYGESLDSAEEQEPDGSDQCPWTVFPAVPMSGQGFEENALHLHCKRHQKRQCQTQKCQTKHSKL